MKTYVAPEVDVIVLDKDVMTAIFPFGSDCSILVDGKPEIG